MVSIDTGSTDSIRPAPVIYVTAAAAESGALDPAELIEIAYLLRSPSHDLLGVCCPQGGESLRAQFDALTAHTGRALKSIPDLDALIRALQAAPEPVNLFVGGAYALVWNALQRDRALFRDRVARVFVIGGHVNDYTGRERRLPVDPRLEQRYPARFAPSGDPRVAPDEAHAWARLLTSGEGVIFLPGDICVWRYAATGLLEDGGATAAYLLTELSAARETGPGEAVENAAFDAPVLLSAFPAFLLAVRPDPTVWLRLFRAVPARVEVMDDHVSRVEIPAESPNLYMIAAIDGQGLGKLLTACLRDRPLREGASSK